MVGLGAVAVEAVGGLHARHEQQRAEGDLALGHEVRLGQWRRRVLGETLIELRVLLLGNLGGLARPDGLVVVHQLPVPNRLLCFLLLRLVFGVLHLRDDNIVC